MTSPIHTPTGARSRTRARQTVRGSAARTPCFSPPRGLLLFLICHRWCRGTREASFKPHALFSVAVKWWLRGRSSFPNTVHSNMAAVTKSPCELIWPAWQWCQSREDDPLHPWSMKGKTGCDGLCGRFIHLLQASVKYVTAFDPSTPHSLTQWGHLNTVDVGEMEKIRRPKGPGSHRRRVPARWYPPFCGSGQDAVLTERGERAQRWEDTDWLPPAFTSHP